MRVGCDGREVPGRGRRQHVRVDQGGLILIPDEGANARVSSRMLGA